MKRPGKIPIRNVKEFLKYFFRGKIPIPDKIQISKKIKMLSVKMLRTTKDFAGIRIQGLL
jgi:hypothetical protein